MNRFLSFVSGALLGAVVGATLALLLTPTSGDDLLARIEDRTSYVREEVRRVVRSLDRRYVILHPLSSNFVRNMPRDVFRALAARLVDATGCDVATLIPTPRVHSRMVDLSDTSRGGYHHFCALIAEAAGMVTVDTSTYHIADAFGTPSVVLFSTIPPRLRVAYYPPVEGIL